MSQVGPPGDAYGRTTNQERYRVLWSAASKLVDELATGYRVQVSDDDPRVDSALTQGLAGGVARVVRLVPQTDGAAPMTVAFSAFPGLAVRFGRWHVERFPVCGCDACNEQPDELVRQLREHVAGLVAGRFIERLVLEPHARLEYSFRTESGSGSPVPAVLATAGRPATIEWSAWQRLA